MAMLIAQWQEELNPWHVPGEAQAAPAFAELGLPGFHHLLLHKDKSLDAVDTVCHLFQARKAILHKLTRKKICFAYCASQYKQIQARLCMKTPQQLLRSQALFIKYVTEHCSCPTAK